MRETLLLDRYRILGDLGTGGFGETFLAEDTTCLPSLTWSRAKGPSAKLPCGKS
ncbi:MAG: hypothetical protein GDA43_13000 [Hormoscilla sp. SP5CHS1]|nr:hypothetical protein [Hormoscilla sp. SP5CHS1]